MNHLTRWESWLSQNRRSASGALFVASFLLYAGSLNNSFVYDDEYQILQNPFVINPHLWSRIFSGSVWSFQAVAFPSNYYRPLHILAHWLIYRLAGPNPAAFHLFQVVIYAATVVVVFRIANRLLRSEVAAFMGALLWAVHPLHVEGVAWIAAVPDTGYGFFYLLGFLMFLRAEQSETNPVQGHALAALAFFPALFFKEMALSFILVVAAYWFTHPPRGGSGPWHSRIVRFLPYVSVVGIYLVIRVVALGYMTHAGKLWDISWRVVGAALGLLGQHTKLFFWPTHLNVFRSFDVESSLRSPWPWLVIAAVVAALWFRKREPTATFLILWWPLGLLPALDIRNLSFPLLAERFSYVPSVSLCVLVSWILFERLPRKLPARWWERVVVPACAAAVIFCAVQTLRAIPNWQSNESLANYSMKQSPDAALLHVIQGFVLQYKEGDLAGARREFETAMRLNAQSPRPLSKVTYDSYIGLGTIAQREGNLDLAVEYLEKATQVSPYDSPAYDALGAIYFPRGDYAKAAEYFSQAVRANPYDLNGRFYLGTCLVKLGQYAEAAKQFRAAREVDPGFLTAYEAEARALESSGLSDEAARVRRMAPTP